MITKIKQQETMLIQNQTNQPIEVHHDSNLRIIQTQSNEPCWALYYRHVQERKHQRTYLSVFRLITNYLSEDMLSFIRSCIDQGISVIIDTDQGILNCDDYLSYDHTGYAPVYLKLKQLQREVNSVRQQVADKQFDYSYLSQMKQQIRFEHSLEWLERKARRYCKLLDLNDIRQVYNIRIQPAGINDVYTEQMELLQALWYLDHGIKPMKPDRAEDSLPWWVY